MDSRKEPEELFKTFGDITWIGRECIVKDLTDNLIELGYYTKEDLNHNVINVICEHGKICRVISLSEDVEGNWTFDIDGTEDDIDTIEEDICEICKKRKIVHYTFDDDALKFWGEKEDSEDFEEIDLNDYINWDEVNNKAVQEMKERFPKGTVFVDMDEE